MEPRALEQKKCVPCQGGIPPLTSEDAREHLSAVSGWELSDDSRQISRQFTFKDFREAMAFVNKVADLAEEEGHHPDFAIHWNKVDLVLYTHKIDGLHENDFIMAAKINGLDRN